ncbi:MAG: dihydrofolate reductase family protein, partial [Muribaculaceae bacterium]|nr:dihydrofolate reductase family protein [Muribaculaceae bacterium]
TRLWPGNSPRPVLFASDRIPPHAAVRTRNPIILDPSRPLEENMSDLYSIHKITSLMVEGGAKTLKTFIDAALFDEIRIETAPLAINRGTPAPTIRTELATLIEDREIRASNIRRYKP